MHRLRIPEVRVESVEKDDTISNKLPGDNSSTTTTATDVPEGADKTDAARHQTVSRREKLHVSHWSLEIKADQNLINKANRAQNWSGSLISRCLNPAWSSTLDHWLFGVKVLTKQNPDQHGLIRILDHFVIGPTDENPDQFILRNILIRTLDQHDMGIKTDQQDPPDPWMLLILKSCRSERIRLLN